MHKIVLQTLKNRLAAIPQMIGMKSIDYATCGISGTARAPGTSRFNRLRGLIRRLSSSAQ